MGSFLVNRFSAKTWSMVTESRMTVLKRLTLPSGLRPAPPNSWVSSLSRLAMSPASRNRAWSCKNFRRSSTSL